MEIRPWLIAISSMTVDIPNLDASLDALNQDEKAELSALKWDKYIKKINAQGNRWHRLFLILSSIAVFFGLFALVYLAGPI